MARKPLILAALLAGFLLLVAILKFGDTAPLLWAASDGGRWLLPLVVASALLDSVNPCAFSVLLLTIAFLFQVGRRRETVLRLGAIYIAGVAAVYLLIGLGILQVLHLFNTPHFMARVGAWLLIALGAVNLANVAWPKFPIKLRLPAASHRAMSALVQRGSTLAVFLLGALVGLCEFPCTGGPYLMVLGLLHDRSTYLPGLGYLLLYNALFITPLVAILLLAGNRFFYDRVSNWQHGHQTQMRLVSGLLMVALGALIFLL